MEGSGLRFLSLYLLDGSRRLFFMSAATEESSSLALGATAVADADAFGNDAAKARQGAGMTRQASPRRGLGRLQLGGGDGTPPPSRNTQETRE